MMHVNETITTNLRSQELGACALIQDLLPLYLEGEVSPGSRDMITEHLAGCERCSGFMAGAQTVRTQLRRDQLQRTESVRQDTPRRGAVMFWRELLAGGMAMLLCLPGGASAAAIGQGLRGDSPDALFVGLFIATGVCAALLALARILGPLTSQRLSAIFGGVALGGAGVILMMSVGSNSAVGILVGFAVGVAGLISVWSGVAREGRLPLSQGA